MYVGTAHERLLKRGPLLRTEGPYAFHRGIPTEVGALKTDGRRILNEEADVPGGALWAVDNMTYFKKKAELNPQTWAYFDKMPSETKVEEAMPDEPDEPEEPAPRKVKK